jgi:hypothetical protein
VVEGPVRDGQVAAGHQRPGETFQQVARVLPAPLLAPRPRPESAWTAMPLPAIQRRRRHALRLGLFVRPLKGVPQAAQPVSDLDDQRVVGRQRFGERRGELVELAVAGAPQPGRPGPHVSMVAQFTPCRTGRVPRGRDGSWAAACAGRRAAAEAVRGGAVRGADDRSSRLGHIPGGMALYRILMRCLPR